MINEVSNVSRTAWKISRRPAGRTTYVGVTVDSNAQTTIIEDNQFRSYSTAVGAHLASSFIRIVVRAVERGERRGGPPLPPRVRTVHPHRGLPARLGVRVASVRVAVVPLPLVCLRRRRRIFRTAPFV